MADDSPITSKVCSKCGVEKPSGAFRGPRRQCRECDRAYTREYNRNRDPEKVRAYLRESRRKNPEKHREWDRRNYEKNKPAGSDYAKRRYQRRDKDKAKAALKAWKAKNPDKMRAIWERKYAKHKYELNERSCQWVRDNPERAAATRARRRARLAGAPGEYSGKDVRDLFRQRGRVCFYCDAPLKLFHVDHFIPLARGGSNGPENLRLSCPTCNLRKNARMPWEFMPEKFKCPEIA